MSDIRVDLATATRDELVNEVVRLHQVCQRWSDGWQDIVAANTKAWGDMVQEANAERDALRRILNADETGVVQGRA